MGLFDWLRGTNSRQVSNHQLQANYSFLFGPTSSGRTVTERSAMQMTAVYSCVRILAEAIAGLPLHVYRDGADGGKEKATDHPLYKVLHDQPNPEMTSFVFRETLMTHLLLWGERVRADHPQRARRGDRPLPAHALTHERRQARLGRFVLRLPDDAR